jgi:hypothetical protein
MKTLTKNLWKVLFLVIVSMSLITFNACDEDDEDPIIGTWILYEMQMGTATLDAAALTEAGYTMTVIFTKNAYTAIGVVGDDIINETGTWTREDSNTVIITNTDGTVTLTKVGEYYTAEFDDGVIGKFKKQ